jgi:acid phosphatase (class A)
MRCDSLLAAAAALTALSLGSLAGSVTLVATASAQSAAPSVPARAPGAMPRPRTPGYFGAEHLPDHTRFLPPPPAVDSPEGVADVAIFRATRALEGSPRWDLATSDDRIGSRKMLGDFGCAMDVDLGTAETPAISRLVARANSDLIVMIGAAKDHYQRPRPFVTHEGPVCIDPEPAFAASGSYPSGHSGAAWLYALLLAELDPEHAAAIVARGRAFGESRVVCGVHYASDVEGGRLTTTALVAALHGSAEFATDIAAAHAELETLRGAAAKPAAASCPADGALARPW